MTLAPLAGAAGLIQLHAAAAVAALALGIYQLRAPKGTRRHRVLGWIWAALLAFVAVSSIWISGERMRFGPFSWIHGLSLFTLAMLPVGLLAARRGRITRHRYTMIGLFVGALVIAGLFTLAPGRIIGRAVWGG